MFSKARNAATAATEAAKSIAGLGKRSRGLAEWHTALSRGFLAPLLERMDEAPIEESYRKAIMTWGVSALWATTSMLGATAGERPWGQQKCFGRRGAYLEASPKDAVEVATAVFAWYVTAPGNGGRFGRHGDLLLDDLERLAEPSPWAHDFAVLALELSRLEETGQLVARGPLLAPMVFAAMAGAYPTLQPAIERIRAMEWGAEEMGLPDLVEWIPRLQLPEPANVLSISSPGQGEVRRLRQEHGAGEIFRLLAAALCGVELTRFLDALPPVVEEAYVGVGAGQILAYTAAQGSLLNRGVYRPLSAGRARRTPLGGLEEDIRLSGRLAAKIEERDERPLVANTRDG